MEALVKNILDYHEFYVAKICESYSDAVQGIFKTCFLLIEAKENARHGEFLKLFDDLPFSERTGQMLIKIGKDALLSNTKYASYLPTSWYNLYELTKLPEEIKQWAFENGKIHPELERSQIAEIKKEYENLETQEIVDEIEQAEEEAKELEIKEGDWVQLGKHFLYVGDTSKPDFYNGLPKVKFAFADPPYNAGVDDWDNDFNWQHDWLIEKSGIVAVTPGISSIKDFMKRTEMPYRWSMATWIKNGRARGALGFGNWIYTALFGDEKIYKNIQDHFSLSIKSSENDDTDFRGRKPYEYMISLIKKFTNESDTVIDPFLGSGTTLLVCEKLNRACIGGEISAERCREIIRRWEALTEQKGVLVENGISTGKSGIFRQSA